MDVFSQYLKKTNEYGIVEKVNYPIAVVTGLPTARPREIVLFESGEIGEVFSLKEDLIEVLIFSDKNIQVGTRLTKTNKLVTIPVGKELLGFVIDPLGQPVSFGGKFSYPKQERDLDSPPPGIAEREKIKKPLKTGMVLVDMLLPIGKGQKELVVGDRKTGKSSFLLTAIKSQIQEGTIIVYAVIGKRKSDIKTLEAFLKKENLSDKVVIVATHSDDSPSLIYLTPYTAMTIAEYFRDQGQDVLLVLDDLSTHAKFYREISLLSNRFPGRESYPGDVFYTHARLLERVGNFKHPQKGEVSITCFPVAETVEGDFAGYIATNLMSMTDGHIYFDSNAYYNGRRPAINVSLSVTRVGRQTQSGVKRSINRELTSFLTLYERMQTLSHFGAELTQSVKDILSMGDRIYKFFDQLYTLIVPEEVQLILFSLLWLKFLDENAPVHSLRYEMIKAYQDEKNKKLFSQVLKAESFNQLLANVSMNKDKLLELCNKGM